MLRAYTKDNQGEYVESLQRIIRRDTMLPLIEEVKETHYHCLESCNKCAGDNSIDIKSSLDGHLVMEAGTKCRICGFEDYWAHGRFESSQEMVSNCRTYL